MNTLKKIKVVVIAIFILSTFSSNFYVKADSLQDQLNQLQSQINDIKSQKDQVQSQINSNNFTIQGFSSQVSQLYGQIQIYGKQISQIKLQIQQFQIKLQILKDSIDKEDKDISKLEDILSSLESESNNRILNSYVNFKMYGSNDSFKSVVNFSKINDYFLNSQYKEFIQSDTNLALLKLVTLKVELKSRKQKLADDLASVKKDEDIVTAQQVDLEKQNEQLNLKVNNLQGALGSVQAINNNDQSLINNFNQTQSQKQHQFDEVQQEIVNNSGSFVSNGFVKEGTRIGIQGRTGIAFAIHLHFVVKENGIPQNPCNYLPGGFAIANGYGDCGNSNRLQWPLKGNVYYVNSWYGSCPQPYCPHLAIDIQQIPAFGAPVFAAQSGYIRKLVSGNANVAIICQIEGCKSGIETQYWHLASFAF